MCSYVVANSIQFMSEIVKGRLVTYLRDRLRDFTANLLSRVGRDVEVESKLQPLTGEIMVRSANTDDNARLDVRQDGL